ncbi:MAG: phosphotransferase [Litoreibacter sp.]
MALKYQDALLAELDALEDINSFLRADAEFEHYTLADIIRVTPNSQVFHVKNGTRNLILKRFTQWDANLVVERMMRDIPRSQQILEPTPAFRINTCISGRPDMGIVFLEYCDGKSIHDHLKKANEAKNKRLIRAAADWLKTFTEPRVIERQFRPHYWIQKSEKLSTKGFNEADRQLFDQALDALRRWAPRVAGVPVRHSVIHGDFHAENLIFRRGITTAVDIQGDRYAPVAYDVAGFLFTLEKNSSKFMTQDALTTLKNEFLTRVGISQQEQDTVLPFLMAARLIRIFSKSSATLDRDNDKFVRMRKDLKKLISNH